MSRGLGICIKSSLKAHISPMDIYKASKAQFLTKWCFFGEKRGFAVTLYYAFKIVLWVIRHLCAHTLGISGYWMHVSTNQGTSVYLSVWLYLHIQIQIQIVETPTSLAEAFLSTFSFKSSSVLVHITKREPQNSWCEKAAPDSELLCPTKSRVT